MTGTKEFRALEKRLIKLGFIYDRTNASSCRVYTHTVHVDLPVNPSISEGAARQLLSKVEKSLGQRSKQPKRKALSVKARHAEERRQLKAEAERLDTERCRLLAERDGLLNGAGSHLTNAEIRDLDRRVAQIEGERRSLEALMTERPAPSNHGVKHRAGQR